MAEKLGMIGGVLALACTLLGCVQAELSSINKRCDFSNDPRFASIRGRLPLDTSSTAPPTVRQISDNTKPTAEQREALLQFDEAQASCRAEKIRLATRHFPSDVVGLLQEVYLAYTNQMKLLVDSQITFGQYANNTHQIYAEAIQVLGKYERAQQAANAASRQAAAAQLSATLQSFQTFNRQPTVTNCNRLGSNISCTTY